MQGQLGLNLFDAEFIGKLDFYMLKTMSLRQSKALNQRHFSKNHG